MKAARLACTPAMRSKEAPQLSRKAAQLLCIKLSMIRGLLVDSNAKQPDFRLSQVVVQQKMSNQRRIRQNSLNT